MSRPSEFPLVDYLGLLDALTRAFGEHRVVAWQVHSTTCASTVVQQTDQDAIQCSWVYGLSGYWSLMNLRRPSPDC